MARNAVFVLQGAFLFTLNCGFVFDLILIKIWRFTMCKVERERERQTGNVSIVRMLEGGSCRIMMAMFVGIGTAIGNNNKIELRIQKTRNVFIHIGRHTFHDESIKIQTNLYVCCTV